MNLSLSGGRGLARVVESVFGRLAREIDLPEERCSELLRALGEAAWPPGDGSSEVGVTRRFTCEISPDEVVVVIEGEGLGDAPDEGFGAGVDDASTVAAGAGGRFRVVVSRSRRGRREARPRTREDGP